MIKLDEWRSASKQALEMVGIREFEKQVGVIQWLHGKEEWRRKARSRYVVIDVTRDDEVVYEGRTLEEVSEEFGISKSAVSVSASKGKTIGGKYRIIKAW